MPVVEFMRGVLGKAPVAVASGGMKPLVMATLEALGIHAHFAAVVTYEDVVHPKPAPDTYLEAARRMGVEPARCLVFEDTPLGIQAATAAGMQSVLVQRPGGRAAGVTTRGDAKAAICALALPGMIGQDARLGWWPNGPVSATTLSQASYLCRSPTTKL